MELIVALSLSSLILAMTVLAVTSLQQPAGGARRRLIAEARARAIRTGMPIVVVTRARDVDSSPVERVLLLPDGRAIGSGVDPLTGVPRDGP